MLGRLRRWLRSEAVPGAPVGNVMSGTARDVVQAQHIENVTLVGLANRDDAQILRDVTDANLRSLADHTGLPSGAGRSVVERSETGELNGTEGNFVITGEPGCGKSGALFRLAEHLRGQGEDVVLLTVETLGEVAGAIRGDVTSARPLGTVLAEWQGDVRGTLLIDGVDAARRESLTWLANLVVDLDGTRWRTIATMRRFDLRHGTTWRKAFEGPPVSEVNERRDSQLADVRHFLLGDFSPAELERLAADDPDVRGLVRGADDHLLRLIRNPFNLRIACDLLQLGEPVLSLASARDQLELLQRYWGRRVLDQPDGEARTRVLTEVSREMLTQRELRASTSVVPDALLDARRAVLRDGVLKEVPGRLRATGPAVLVFSHHILFDYAVAALLLTEADRSRLTKALDEDPNLVLVARPSVHLHLADVWHADDTRRDFAEAMTGLAESGHSLAGIAAASVLVTETREDDDLRWFTELPAGSEHTASVIAMVGWTAGVMSAAGEQLRARVRSAVGLWTTLALHLVDRLERDFDGQLASQVFRLLQQLQDVQPLRPETTSAEGRADCLAAMMTNALNVPDERGWLASAVARFLPAAVEVRPEHAEVLRRTLAPVLMASWPSMYLHHYVDNIEVIAKADAQLAEQVLLAIWRFREDSDEITSLSQGVVALTSTRKQDVEHLKWLIGKKFHEYVVAVGLQRAVPVLVEATTPNDTDLPTTIRSYPVTVGSAVGQVDLMMGSLRFSGAHESPATILESFVKVMRTAEMAVGDADRLVADLASSIRHPEAWHRILLGAADNPAVVGRAFAPALLAGGLFAHPDTRAAACALVRSVIPHLSDDELDPLETAISGVPALLGNATGERARAIVDQIIGCLDADRIRDPALAARLTQLDSEGGPPEIVDFDDEIGELWGEPTNLRDYLDNAYDELTEVEREALDSVRLAIDATENSPGPEVVETLENALWHAVKATEDLFARAPLHKALGLVVRAVEVLITKRDPKPGSPLGELIISLLLDAASRVSGDDETDEQW